MSDHRRVNKVGRSPLSQPSHDDAASYHSTADSAAARVRCEQVQGTWDRRQHGRATLSLKMRRLLQRALRRLCYQSYQLQLLWQRLQYVWHKPYMHRFALSLRKWTADLRRGRLLWSWRNLQGATGLLRPYLVDLFITGALFGLVPIGDNGSQQHADPVDLQPTTFAAEPGEAQVAAHSRAGGGAELRVTSCSSRTASDSAQWAHNARLNSKH
jgi:hypothetical protein